MVKMKPIPIKKQLPKSNDVELLKKIGDEVLYYITSKSQLNGIQTSTEYNLLSGGPAVFYRYLYSNISINGKKANYINISPLIKETDHIQRLFLEHFLVKIKKINRLGIVIEDFSSGGLITEFLGLQDTLDMVVDFLSEERFCRFFEGDDYETFYKNLLASIMECVAKENNRKTMVTLVHFILIKDFRVAASIKNTNKNSVSGSRNSYYNYFIPDEIRYRSNISIESRKYIASCLPSIRKLLYSIIDQLPYETTIVKYYERNRFKKMVYGITKYFR